MEGKDKVEDLPEGVTVENISNLPLWKKLLSQSCFDTAVIRVQPFNQILPSGATKYLKRIRDFEIRDDDVWISAFMKTGSTWAKEMVWLIMNNADTKKASEVKNARRAPWFERTAVLPGYGDHPESFNECDKMTSPRLIKTHLSYEMLPRQLQGKRLIYVTRNPRDVCVSLHNHFKLLFAYTGSMEDLAEIFLSDDENVYYGPYLSHVLDYWNQRHLPNILVIKYEEMIEDLSAVMRKVAKFLGKEINEDDLRKCGEYLSFDKMKANPAVNKEEYKMFCDKLLKQYYGVDRNSTELSFVNKGKIGNWKQYIGGALLDRFETWESKRLKGSDLSFTFE